MVYIVCGEASGDLHAANLVREWKMLNSQIQFRAWGGDRLEAENVVLDKHISALSFMGFWEVIKNIFVIGRQFRTLKKTLLETQPKLLVLVDYPGFNLRMAKWAHSQQINVLYYISPTVWAWKRSRVFTIQKYVTKLYCILPFEVEFYSQFGMQPAYFGHPLLDEIDRFNETRGSIPSFEKPVLALLPGSRMQEIEKKLPLMLKAASNFELTHQIALACSPNIPLSVYQTLCQGKDVFFNVNHTYDLLGVAELALVSSGTATLETALFKVPQVVCYKGSNFSVWLARKLVKIKYISLVNLIMDAPILTELIQEHCTSEEMKNELQDLLPGMPKREIQLKAYRHLAISLKQAGASRQIAESMNNYLWS